MVSTALLYNTTGANNTANGFEALLGNTTGKDNTANGYYALASNTTGTNNIANGFEALLRNTTGGFNIALGNKAGVNLTTGSNNIEIGSLGVAGDDSKIRIGTVGTQNATFVAGISGAAVTGTAVVVNSSGQLGVAPSSGRFKEAIKPMDKASEAILALKPVTFHYKKGIDSRAIPQFGLVAEEVEKVNPDLVARDGENKVYTVRYDAVNAMLLNEFLKEHRKVEQQQATMTESKSTIAKQEAAIAQLKKEMETMIARLKEQDAKIQKVSAQLEASKPAPQVVNDP